MKKFVAKILGNWWPFLVILLLSVWAIAPLFQTGYFSMHDDQHVGRLYELHQALVSGQFPVRWVADLGFGLGYPLFNFYPPLVYYLGEIFHLLGANYIDSIKLVWAVALVGSALAMYFLAKEFFGKIGGVVSAMFYLYAPYHAVDAYVRGALAELFSFVFLPLILLFSYKMITTKQTNYAIVTGIILGLLMLTHNLIFLPFFGFLVMWYFSLALIISRQNLVRLGLYFMLITGIAFGLTAFFWLPALSEKQFTLVDQLLIKNLASYQIHFVCPAQLWESLWGYGGSVAGCMDGLSLKVGKIHLLVSLLTGGIGIYFLLRKKATKEVAIIGIALTLFFISLFMTLEVSQPIWDHVSLLWYLQFPWRFLEFATLFASLLSGGVVLIVKNVRLKVFLAVACGALVLWFNAKYFVPQTIRAVADQELTSKQTLNWDVSSTSFEYLPKQVATKITSLGVLWVDIEKDGVPPEKYQVLSGKFTEEKSQFVSGRFSLKGNFETVSQVQFSTVNFPGWKVWVDDQEVAFRADNKYHQITVDVDPGRHTITGKFTNTTVRNLGDLISVIFIAIVPSLAYALSRIKK